MRQREIPLQLTTRRPTDMGTGALPSRELHPEMQRYLEPEPPAVPWWDYPGVRAHLALQAHMTPAKMEALFALAGRTDEQTLAEVALRFRTRPERLLRWHQAADQEVRRFLAHLMEDVEMPRRPRPTVQTLCQRRALSLSALADAAGVSISTAFRAVHGLPIRPSSKQALAKALQLAPERINWQPPAA